MGKKGKVCLLIVLLFLPKQLYLSALKNRESVNSILVCSSYLIKYSYQVFVSLYLTTVYEIC